ncbi:MAG: hypothetical protein K2J66_04265, partial [Muribaculaceae bacterium]|nr:hypothetical protein [Muribaculaceae bacterium]
IKKGYINGDEIYTIFEDSDYGDIELIVPDESIDAYRTSLGWHYFSKISPLTAAGVDNITTEEEDECQAIYYDILGRVVTNPKKGNLYIRHTPSKTTKVIY